MNGNTMLAPMFKKTRKDKVKNLEEMKRSKLSPWVKRKIR